MPVTMARLSGFQSAKSARWYQALTGPTQATGSAGGYDLLLGLRKNKNPAPRRTWNGGKGAAPYDITACTAPWLRQRPDGRC